jgi:hypothetical protein
VHATTTPVSAPQPAIKGAQAAQDAATAWKDVRADPSIQFGPLPVELPSLAAQPQPSPPVVQPTLPAGAPGSLPPGTPKPPSEPGPIAEAIRNLFEPIGKALGIAWPVMQWVLLAIGAAIVLYGLYRLIRPWLELSNTARAEADAAAATWTPARAEAEALLDEADVLAGQGKYAEATHLLLKRSVDHIAAARPEWVLPASTTREITAIDGLPAAARKAFGQIAQRVEHSLFALRSLDAQDWQAARAAYAEFALERLTEQPR